MLVHFHSVQVLAKKTKALHHKNIEVQPDRYKDIDDDFDEERTENLDLGHSDIEESIDELPLDADLHEEDVDDFLDELGDHSDQTTQVNEELAGWLDSVKITPP